MEGPDGQCVREREDAHHGGLDDQGDHLELNQYIEELNISVLVGDEGLEMKQEGAANAELDQLWKSKREREDYSAKWVVVVGEESRRTGQRRIGRRRTLPSSLRSGYCLK